MALNNQGNSLKEKSFDWNTWMLAIRLRTLPAAAAGVITGSALAWYDGSFQPAAALACLFTAILLQIGSNLANDVFDFERGTDTAERAGPLRVTQAGLLTPSQVKMGMLVVFGLAGLCGLYLAWLGGWPIILLGIAAILSAIAYTGGPFPLGYYGLAPVSGRMVTRFGARTETAGTMKGTEIETRPGAQIVATFDGQIVFEGPFRGYGQILIIEHTGGYHTILAGLDRVSVEVGQWLKAGEPIGRMGAAGELETTQAAQDSGAEAAGGEPYPPGSHEPYRHAQRHPEKAAEPGVVVTVHPLGGGGAGGGAAGRGSRSRARLAIPVASSSDHGDHAYVFYQIPDKVRKFRLVFWHGHGQSAKTWETTPDGREGSQNIFLRKRYGVYLIDQPRRSRAARSTEAATISATPDEQLWFGIFRLGARPDFYPGVQFSKDPEALNQFFRQMVANTGSI